MNVRSEHVQGYKEMKIPYNIIRKTEKIKGLVIILPGFGYTVKAPILHFATGAYLNHGYEVLHVNYQYHTDTYDHFTYEELEEAVITDVNAVLDKALSGSDYESYIVMGKSFGTIAMGHVLNKEKLSDSKAIWLTPLLNKGEIVDAMMQSQNKGLCIIGDKDHFYDKKQIDQLNKNNNIEYHILPELNHILEYDNNVLESIDAIKKIIHKIIQF